MSAEKLLLSILGICFAFFLSIVLIVSKSDAKPVSIVYIEQLVSVNDVVDLNSLFNYPT